MKFLFTCAFFPMLVVASQAQTQPSGHVNFDNAASEVARFTVEPPPQWGEVLFANAVLVGLPEVTNPYVSVDDGRLLVGTNFIAELYYGTNFSSMIRLSNAPPARFRREGTALPGTWSGGMRTLVGIPPGTQTYMQMVMWDNDAAETLEEARRNNGPYILSSSAFTYVPPPPGSPMEAHYMKNFEGLWGDCTPPLTRPPPSILVQPTNQTVQVGDNVVISVLSTNFCAHQWQYNGTNINVLPGSRFLVLTNVQPSQAGDYRVIVGGPAYTSPGWGPFVTSQVARLTVEPPPQWGEVLFANDVLVGLPEVTHPYVLWGTEMLVGTNWLAQLFYGTNEFNLIPVTNAPATFRQPTTFSPGTWRGGRRPLTGVLPGARVFLRVRIWDGDWFPTYEEAATHGGLRGESAVFTYTPPPHDSPPESYYMRNFEGFWIPCGTFFSGPAGIREQPTNQVAFAGQSVVFSVIPTNACVYQWQFNGSNLPGLFARKLWITNVQPHHAGDYRVIAKQHVSSQSGATSEVARLTVHPPPEFTSARFEDGAFAFGVTENTGRTIVIETAPDLNPGTIWTPVFTNTAPFGFTNSTPANRQRFYRTVIR